MAIDPSEFILGEDVTELVARTPSPGLVVSARLDRSDSQRLLAVARETSRTVSQVTREAIHRYLSEYEKDRRFQVEATWTTSGVVFGPEPRRKTSASIVSVMLAAAS